MMITSLLLGLILVTSVMTATAAVGKKLRLDIAGNIILGLAALSLYTGGFSFLVQAIGAAQSGLVYSNAFITAITTVTGPESRVHEIAHFFAASSQIAMMTMAALACCGIMWQWLRHRTA